MPWAFWLHSNASIPVYNKHQTTASSVATMDMTGMSMGMDMGSGIPSRFDLQKMFWAVVGAAIGCATLVNVYNQLLYRQR